MNNYSTSPTDSGIVKSPETTSPVLEETPKTFRSSLPMSSVVSPLAMNWERRLSNSSSEKQEAHEITHSRRPSCRPQSPAVSPPALDLDRRLSNWSSEKQGHEQLHSRKSSLRATGPGTMPPPSHNSLGRRRSILSSHPDETRSDFHPVATLPRKPRSNTTAGLQDLNEFTKESGSKDFKPFDYSKDVSDSSNYIRTASRELNEQPKRPLSWSDNQSPPRRSSLKATASKEINPEIWIKANTEQLNLHLLKDSEPQGKSNSTHSSLNQSVALISSKLFEIADIFKPRESDPEGIVVCGDLEIPQSIAAEPVAAESKKKMPEFLRRLIHMSAKS